MPDKPSKPKDQPEPERPVPRRQNDPSLGDYVHKDLQPSHKDLKPSKETK